MSETEPHQDESIPVEYVAGLLDGRGTIRVQISKHKDLSLGYNFYPNIIITSSSPATMGLLDEFCQQHDIECAVGERTSNTGYQFTVNSPDDVGGFLSLLQPYLVEKYEDAHLMLNEIIPRLNEATQDKDVAIEMMEYVDELHEGRRGQRRKYTADYFRDEWS